MAGDGGNRRRTVLAYFGHDRTDSAVIRRIASLRAADATVLGATFRREKFNRDARPDWDDLDLGTSRDRAFARRVLLLARAVLRLWGARRRFAGADLFMARNLDMALLALLARAMAGSRAPLVYEVLDVHRALARDTAAGRVGRWVERRVLAHTDLLAVSSPAFVERYFRPVQGYRGRQILLENRIAAAQLPAPTADIGSGTADTRPPPGRPWVVGWFGTLRCVRSLGLLAGVSDRLGPRLQVDLRGLPTETGLAPFLDVVRRHPGLAYGGEFKSPRDLGALYGGVHLAWCFDFHDAGANSRWLLPNRLYDAGFHGVPCLALAGTETGRRIVADGLGWALEEPLERTLPAFLETLTAADWAARRAAILALPRSLFCETDDGQRLIATALTPVAAGADACPALLGPSAAGAAAPPDAPGSGAGR